MHSWMMFSARVFFFGVVDKGGNTVDDVEIGYDGGNGIFSSICVLLASESGMKLLEVE